ncbi:hypothetical protein LUCX_64 [Xanthomonas phage vB_XciM_LucasX]|nr:hypothetical protein LUCX_64 [Xanthomonas phage vB_XciM_LucasX]
MDINKLHRARVLLDKLDSSRLSVRGMGDDSYDGEFKIKFED